MWRKQKAFPRVWYRKLFVTTVCKTFFDSYAQNNIIWCTKIHSLMKIILLDNFYWEDLKKKNVQSNLLTPTTGSSAHKGTGFMIIKKCSNRLTNWHGWRFFIRIHELNGWCFWIFGNHCDCEEKILFLKVQLKQ